MDQADGGAAVPGAAFRAYVASKHGITLVEVEDDEVTGYQLLHECTATDVAETADGRVAVATPKAVLLGDTDGFEATGFGSAVAIGGDPLLAASAKGHVAEYGDGEWERIGTLPGDVNAIDGDLLATGEGVFRVTDGGIQHVGLTRANDVSTPGVPHAATEAGLYKLGAGWMDAADGAFTLVSADPGSAEPGILGRAHAATREQLFVYDGDSWGPWHIPVGADIVGIGYADAVYALSEDGTLVTAKGEEWRTRSLGISGVTGLVVQAMEENA